MDIPNRLSVHELSKIENPQTVIYQALHQDYSAYPVYNQAVPDEETCGMLAVKNLLKGKTFHGGPLEHPAIIFNVVNFPHSTMQQLRTHRIGCSFDCQSFRYTGEHLSELGELFYDKNIYDLVNWENPDIIDKLEDAFYLRPLGSYTNRKGKSYTYDYDTRLDDLRSIAQACARYYYKFEILGYSEEHCRGVVPFDYRQHWVMSANLRAVFHILDMRHKRDAQLECQWLMELLYPYIKSWVPQIAEWYSTKRLGKGLLAP